MVDERIAARRAEVRDDRRRRRLRRTILAATLLVLLAVAVAVERSPLVALAEVRVEGAQRLDPEVIRDAADLPLGTSTLRLRLDAARARVESLPLVASASVSRVDPLTVVVAVEERVPVAVVTRGRQHVLVDAEGVVVAPGQEPGLARIMVLAGRFPAVGETLAEAPTAANAHAAVTALPGPLRALVAAYEARGPDELDLRLTDGTLVRFGRADRVDEKARSLGAVIEDLGGRPVAEIDVRAPGRPVVVPAD